ncbi:MAG: glutamine--fructose-6-phosphate transaminase (isomerizing) [Deltaproteobacteria bacterium]|nr:glutamine--fructose-6-phosphate transaminase (isomerizing) [Deltaproteobacteria bacterium]
MCGIVGYIGPRACAPLLIDGLRKLEYRGYDSAGLAVIDTSPTALGEPPKLGVVRSVGKLGKLDDAIRERPLPGNIGIGHTRWATHGRPTEGNAHPHLVGDVAVVHNGILENHVELRNELVALGRKFLSETDTEIAAHLIDIELANGAPTLLEATKLALSRVRGAYAIAAVSRREPDVIVVAKSFSPLVLGIGDGEVFAASDVPALIQHTRDVIFLEDGDICELRAGAVKIERLLVHGDGSPERITVTPVVRHPRRIDWSPAQAEKQGYKHFMLKEIFEQPTALENTLRGRVSLDDGDINSGEIGLSPEIARSIRRVVLLACGTSHHAAIAGRNWIESVAKVPATVELASEFRYRDAIIGEGDLVIAVSQSGETADTLAAVRDAKRQGAHILAVANVVGSAIPRVADASLYTHAGPEIGVASTKAFTTQLSALLMFAVWLGRRRETLGEDRAKQILQRAIELPTAMREVLDLADACQKIARRQIVATEANHCLFLGRGLSYPIALEGALKLKEISYVHAEGYAAGEMKHGPIALIDAAMPVVVVAPKDHHYEKIASNVQEVRAREGRVIAVVPKGDTTIAELAQDVIEIPDVDPELTPFITVIPLQLIAYHAADLKGTDVDQPRNLAKTVTVE